MFKDKTKDKTKDKATEHELKSILTEEELELVAGGTRDRTVLITDTNGANQPNLG